MNALIIYDDQKIAARAYALLEIAASRAGQADSWSIWLWQLDQLTLPSRASAALAQAIDAHLIVLAVRGRNHSPTRLLEWLETWAGRREVLDAALALFDGGEGGPLSPTAAPEMSEFARRHDLSLIVGDVEANHTAPAPCGAGRMEAGIPLITMPQLNGDWPGDRRYRSFGINE